MCRTRSPLVKMPCRLQSHRTYVTAPRAIFLSSSGILSDRLFDIVTVLPSSMVLMASSPLLPPFGPNAAESTCSAPAHASSCIMSESSCPKARQIRVMMRLNKSFGIGVSLMRVSRNAHRGMKHLVQRGIETRSGRGGEAGRIVAEMDAVGDVAATVAARFKGGGAGLLGVASGDASFELGRFTLLPRPREDDRYCSNPRPRVDANPGGFKADDAGEPRRSVLPGMMGILGARSGRGAAAIPSHTKSSMG